MDIDYKFIGRNIKIRRKLAGLTQVQLGERLGISTEQLRKIENGHVRLTLDLLAKIAEELNTGFNYLLGHGGEASKNPALIDNLLYVVKDANQEQLLNCIKVCKAILEGKVVVRSSGAV